ncbi:MAG: hypothetical protein EA396_06330 [Anaerolineaceae bacterium]|nr:MAG: hypothetical protein EA396_06330 [Anaerolineaceae bacterium]
MSDYPEIDYVVVERKRRAWWKRPGCLLILVAWLALMSVPFFILLLAFQGEMTLGRGGDVPNKHQHPVLQVRLIMDMDYRGLNITTSSVHRADSDNLCVQNNIRFLLWEGEGENVTNCHCYSREDETVDWASVGVESGACD